MEREFLIYSRRGVTRGPVKDLRRAGQLDGIHQAIIQGLFLSHGHRHDTLFHVSLNGPPNPPVLLSIAGAELRDARIGGTSWVKVFDAVLSGQSHPGVTMSKTSFQTLIKERAAGGTTIHVLEEGGKDLGDHLKDISWAGRHLFVLGDHVGLPRKEEGFALRFGSKVRVGATAHLASTVVALVHAELDRLPLKTGASGDGSGAPGPEVDDTNDQGV